jgi:hypothetical protein
MSNNRYFRHVKKVSVFIMLFEEECAALVRFSKVVTGGTIIVQGTAFFLPLGYALGKKCCREDDNWQIRTE